MDNANLKTLCICIWSTWSVNYFDLAGYELRYKNHSKTPFKVWIIIQFSLVNDIKFSIGDDGVDKFRQTIFDHFLDISMCNFQGQTIKSLMLFELKHKDMDILHIRHMKGNVLCFSIRDFAIITALKCTGNVDEFRYPEFTPIRLLAEYFPSAVSKIHKRTPVQRFCWVNGIQPKMHSK
ncbi:MAG: hypothetical protein Q8839_02535 [Candidatus Phytoplasma australasiaticum]|nr:hypothetical protein [Candidatus Phytoplasma australasiaticum]